ncbi:MAG: hypothetical protein V4530_00835 [Pseudomonadota bacterium]
MSKRGVRPCGCASGRRILASGLVAICALFSSACAAADGHSWQCSAPEGSFSAHDLDVPETATQITGEMMIVKANGASGWRPSAKIAFTDRDSNSPDCHCNGVVATWYPQDPEFLYVFLSIDGQNVTLGKVPYGKPVKFKLKFASDGVLSLEVGTGLKTGISSATKRNNLHLSCSTADADFRLIDVR